MYIKRIIVITELKDLLHKSCFCPKVVLKTTFGCQNGPLDPPSNSGPSRTAIGNRNWFGRQFLAVKSGLWDQFVLPQWSCFPVLTTEKVEWVYTSNAHATITDVSPKACGCSALFWRCKTPFCLNPRTNQPTNYCIKIM